MATLSERERLERENLRADTEAKLADVLKLTREAELYSEQAKLERRREKLVDSRTIYLTSDIEELDIERVVEELRDLRNEGNSPITLYLNSPGGDVFQGYMLFDLIDEARKQDGIHFTTRVRGLAASMASVLSQAGDNRVISRNSWYMVHEPSTIMWGKAGDIKREADLMRKLHDQQCAILAERSNLSFREIKRKSQDKDWWMSAKEALEHGFFDTLG